MDQPQLQNNTTSPPKLSTKSSLHQKNAIIKPENSKDDLERIKKKKRKRIKLIITLAILVVLIVLLVVLWKRISKPALKFTFKIGKKLAGLPRPLDKVVIFSIFIIGSFFGIPGIVVLAAVIAQAKQEIWTPYILYLLAVIITANFHFFLFTRCCRNWLIGKVKDTILFKVLKEQSKERPFTISYLIRWLAIPPLYQTVVISLSEVSYGIFLLSFLLQIWAYSLIMCFIGSTVKNENEIFSKKPFLKQNRKEKMSSILKYVAIFISITLITVISILASRKMKKLKKKHKKLNKKRGQKLEINPHNPELQEEEDKEQNAFDERKQVSMNVPVLPSRMPSTSIPNIQTEN